MSKRRTAKRQAEKPKIPFALQEVDSKIQAALQLTTQGEADTLIGSPDETLKTLEQGAESLHLLFWTMAHSNGCRVNDETLRMAAQAQMVGLVLVHYAYALGVKEGIRRANVRGSEV